MRQQVGESPLQHGMLPLQGPQALLQLRFAKFFLSVQHPLSPATMAAEF